MELLFAEATVGLLPFHDAKAERKRMASVKAPRLASASPLLSIHPRLLSSYPTQPSPPLNQGPRTQKRCACSARPLCRAATEGRAAGSFWSPARFQGEGKSMLSANLAIVCAQRGKRVLLVDGDLRTPVLHHDLSLQTTHGLSSLLSAESCQRLYAGAGNSLPAHPKPLRNARPGLARLSCRITGLRSYGGAHSPLAEKLRLHHHRRRAHPAGH